jgi:L-gulonate 5-dehydrogenase
MRALVMREFGAADVLALEDAPEPEPGPGEVLVRVAAVEVSRTRDVAVRSGHHPFSRQVTLPHVLGGDFAGTVEQIGAGVGPGLEGARVAVGNSIGCGECEACADGREPECPRLVMLGIHRWGSYAELVAMPAANLYAVPDGMGMAEAAALAATGPIAYAQLDAAGVAPGDWLLVTGASGSLGSTLTALAAARGVGVIGLARRPEAIAGDVMARVDAAADDVADALLGLTGPGGLTAVIDNVAVGELFARYLPALGTGGRIVVSGAIGQDVLPVPATPFYIRSQSLIGLRTATPRHRDAFWKEADRGFRLPPEVVRTLPLAAVADAHGAIEAGTNLGHAVLEIA